MHCGNDPLLSTNGRHRSVQPRIYVRHLDVLSCMSSDLIQSSPFFKSNFLQSLLDVKAKINTRDVFETSCGFLCAFLAIGAYASYSVDDVERYYRLKPAWFRDTDRFSLSCSNADDAGDMSISEHEFGLLQDLFNRVVAADTAINE